MKKAIVLGVAVLAGVVPASAGAGGETSCVGELTENVSSNLVVPAGASCSLTGVTVRGNVRVQENASFYANGAAIGGSVRCRSCSFVDLYSSTIGRSVLVEGEIDGSYINDNTIGGDLEIAASWAGGAVFEIQRNRIGRDLRFKKNTGTAVISGNVVGKDLEVAGNAGAIEVSGNQAKHSLECTGNNGLRGGGNSAKRKRGECAAL